MKRLTSTDVREIKKYLTAGYTQSDVARRTGRSLSTVVRVHSGKLDYISADATTTAASTAKDSSVFNDTVELLSRTTLTDAKKVQVFKTIFGLD